MIIDGNDTSSPIVLFITFALGNLIANNEIPALGDQAAEDRRRLAVVNAAAQWFMADAGRPDGPSPITYDSTTQQFGGASAERMLAYTKAAAEWYAVAGDAMPEPDQIPWNDIPWRTVPWEWMLGGGYAVDWAKVASELIVPAGPAPEPVDWVDVDWSAGDVDIQWGMIDFAAVPWRRIRWEDVDWSAVPATTAGVLQALGVWLPPGNFPPPTDDSDTPDQTDTTTPPDEDDGGATNQIKGKGMSIGAFIGWGAVIAVTLATVVATVRMKR